MKKVSIWLLFGSLAANAVLLSLYVGKAASPAASAASQAGFAGSTATGRAAAQTEEARVAEERSKQADAAIWATDTSEKFGPLVARLRAAGFPLHVIKVILRVQNDEYFAAKRKALLPETDNPVPFWDTRFTGFGFSSTDPNKQAIFRELMREHSKIAKDLLGPTGDNISQTDEDYRLYQQRQYGNLPPEKLDEIQKLASDYNDLRQEIYNTSGMMPLPEDREKLTLLEKAQRAEIAKLLTPAELEDYDLRSNPTARQLANRLGTFKPTEEEFRTIFKLQRALDEQLGGASATNAAQFQERQARQREVDVQIAAALGPQRAIDYKLISDPALSSLGRIANRFGLPSQTAFEVAALQGETMKRVGALRADTTLAPDQRTEQLAALATEVNAKVEQTLGPRALQAYKEYGGQWLQMIQPRDLNRGKVAPPSPKG